MEKGFGVRTVGSQAKVDEHTLFGIASDSKAFTTVALGILKDRGEPRLGRPRHAISEGIPAL